MSASSWLARLLVIGAVLLFGSPALAGATVTLNTTSGHPASNVSVSGSGFIPNEAIDIYFDLTDELLVFSDGSGNISKRPFTVPANALPGQHWISAVGRTSGDGNQAQFTVRTNWLEYGFNPKGRRYNAWENVISPSNVNQLDVAWTAYGGGQVNSSPAYYGGNVYVGSTSGTMYAFNASTGAVVWTNSAAQDEINLSSPAVGSNIVYVGSWDHHLYAFNTSTGALVWSAATGGMIESSPAVNNNIVYVGSLDGKVYAFNATTGAGVWTATTGGPVYSSPAVANGYVYVGSDDKKMYAFNASTGAQIWTFPTGGVIRYAPAVADGRVLFASDDGDLYAVKATSGAAAWLVNLAESAASAPAVANGVAYVCTFGPEFFAVNVSTGNGIWTGSCGATNSSPLVANGIVYIQSNGNLDAYNALTGSSLGSLATGAEIESSPAVGDGMVFVGSQDGNLYSFALNAGNNAEYARTKGAAAPPFKALHPDMRLKAMH